MPKTLKGGMLNIDYTDSIEELFNIVSGEDNPQKLRLFIASTSLPSNWMNIDGNDKYNLTPLMRAAKAGNTQIIKVLIELGADVNKQARISKYTALQQAVYYKHVESEHELRSHGANPYLKNIYDEDANTIAITNVVLKNGVQASIRQIKLGDEDAIRSLYVACQSDYMGDEAGRRVHEKWTQRRLETDFADPVTKYTGPRTRFWIITIPVEIFKTLTNINPLLSGGDAVIGSVAVQPIDETTGEVVRMCAHPKIRRAGIASILLSYLENWAKTVGYQTLRLTTLAHMTAAMEFYKSRDYKLINVKQKEYAGTTIELSEFEKSLITTKHKYLVFPGNNEQIVIKALERRGNWELVDATTLLSNEWDFCWNGNDIHEVAVPKHIQLVSNVPKPKFIKNQVNLVKSLRIYYDMLNFKINKHIPESYIISNVCSYEYNIWVMRPPETWIVKPNVEIEPIISNSISTINDFIVKNCEIKGDNTWLIQKYIESTNNINVYILITHSWDVYVCYNVGSSIDKSKCNELILDAICATRGEFAASASRPWFEIFTADIIIDKTNNYLLDKINANPIINDINIIESVFSLTVDKYFIPLNNIKIKNEWEMIWSDKNIDPMLISHQVSMSKKCINVETVKARHKGPDAIRLAMQTDKIGDLPFPVENTTTSFIASRFISVRE